MTEEADPWDQVRIATPEDYQELFRICCLLHAENGQHPFSEKRVTEALWRGCHRDGAIIGVIGPHDDIRATIYLQLAPIYYSDDMQLYELHNYVRPDWRRKNYAARMIRFAKRCADETGLDLTIGIISDERLAAKTRLYERELSRGGAFFIHRPAVKAATEAAA